jgi:hypothetical protein
MNSLNRLFVGILKYFIVSAVVTAISFIATVSVVTGKFPPSWSQIKGVKKNLDGFLALKDQLMNQQGLLLLQQQMQNMAQNGKGAGSVAAEGMMDFGSATNGDPDLRDIDELMNHRQNQAAMSKALSGEATFASSPPPGQAAGAAATVEVSPELTERVRKLEDLVASLHSQVQRLNAQLNAVQQRPQSPSQQALPRR